MKTITVSVNEETYRLARIRAMELDTSISMLVQQFLRSLVSSGETAFADGQEAETETETALARRRQRLREVLANFDARKVGVPERLTRDELYDEAIHGPDALR